MSNKDYYQILGVPRDASVVEIKKAFRVKAKEYHPELNNSPGAEDNFVLVNEAYDILIHPKTREIHNAELTNFFNPMKHTSYAHWLQVARERGMVHQRLPYNEFIRTKFYHSTHTFPYFLFVAEFIIGISLLGFSLFTLWYTESNKVLSVILFLISLPVAIFLLVQAAAGFSSMSKFRKFEKRKIAKSS